MRGPHNIWRLVRTGATFERTGAMQVVLDAFEAPKSLRVAARILGWPFKWLGLKGDPAMPPATRALTSLGPAYIKFGQILSTRPDVVGEELALRGKELVREKSQSRDDREEAERRRWQLKEMEADVATLRQQLGGMEQAHAHTLQELERGHAQNLAVVVPFFC